MTADIAQRPDDKRLAEAERLLRAFYCDFDGHRGDVHLAVETLLAEYDRRGAELVRVPSDMDVLRAERDRCASQVERLRHSHCLVGTEMEQACANVDRLQREAIARDAELERLEAQRGAVLALHKPWQLFDRTYCEDCGHGSPWPCPTAKALGVGADA